MKREIKFRGKTYTQKWITGFYYYNYRLRYHRIKNRRKDYIVREDTIGQYIGRKDANGKEVYEGDILLSSYGNAKFLVGYSDELAAFAIANVNDLKNEDLWMIWMPIKMNWWKEYTPTIIGNIFDNPELIK